MIKLLFFGRLGDFAEGVSASIDATEGLTPATVRDALAADHPTFSSPSYLSPRC